jgi:ankyrin repeat protein
LVQNGVNPDKPNMDNQTPLHLACKKQYAEIVQFIKLFRNEDITLKRILSDYSVSYGQYVNESKLRKEIKAEFGFTKSAIDLILSIH